MTRAVETCCLFLLLAVVGLRPLIAETYQSAASPFTTSDGLKDPWPAATLALDGVILLAATVWLVMRALRPGTRYRWCGLELGAALVAVAGVISCLAAGNQRLAVNATVDWLMLPVITVMLVQLLRGGWHVRLVLAVILATAAVQAYECANQVFSTFAETEEFYEQHKDLIWAQREVDVDSPQVAMYERRLYGREASGFLAHSNVTGAYLVLTGLAALALAWSRWRSATAAFERVFAALAGVAGVALLGAAGLTRSRGALAAGAVGVIVWCLRGAAGSWIKRHRRRTLWLGWGLAVGGALAVIGHGLYHKGLPGASLDFRWQYWTASWPVIGDHWLTGVGRENFGRHYLEYKPVQSPEEVSNPHNFLVSAAAEWGVIGLAGVLVMLVGGSIVATRPSRPEVGTSDGRPGGMLRWGVALSATVFVVRLLLLGSDDVNYLFVATAIPLIVWAVAFAVMSIESGAAVFKDHVLPGLAVGVNCALLAFVLQDTINFALFTPGAATTFFALLAVPMALGANEAESPNGRREGQRADMRRWVLPAVAGAVLVFHVGWVLTPVARAGAALDAARDTAGAVAREPYRVQPAYVAYLRAAEFDQLDPTPLAEAAVWLTGFAQVGPDPDVALARAVELADGAIARDPFSTSLHRQKMRICRYAHRTTGDRRYLSAAIEAAREVVRLYPQSPDGQADLGTCLLDAGRKTWDAETLTDARRHLVLALELDDARPEWEELRRLPQRRREEIQAGIDDATGLLDE